LFNYPLIAKFLTFKGLFRQPIRFNFEIEKVSVILHEHAKKRKIFINTTNILQNYQYCVYNTANKHAICECLKNYFSCLLEKAPMEVPGC